MLFCMWMIVRRINTDLHPARHDVYTAARTAKLGLKLSLTYGLLQDALETLKGNRPTYVDFLLGNRWSKARKEGSI